MHYRPRSLCLGLYSKTLSCVCAPLSLDKICQAPFWESCSDTPHYDIYAARALRKTLATTMAGLHGIHSSASWARMVSSIGHQQHQPHHLYSSKLHFHQFSVITLHQAFSTPPSTYSPPPPPHLVPNSAILPLTSSTTILPCSFLTCLTSCTTSPSLTQLSLPSTPILTLGFRLSSPRPPLPPALGRILF